MLYWKRLVIIMPLLLSATAFAAQAPAAKPAPPKQPTDSTPQVIRAQKIELTDSKGNVRVSIGVSADDQAIIRLFDKDGKETMALKSDDGLGILSNEGKRKIVVGSSGAGYGIGVYDSKGNPRAELTLVDGEPYMAMSDSNGKFRASMFLLKDQPFVSLTDGKDNGALIDLEVRGSAPKLLLSDSSGKARAECSLTDDGVPRLSMANSTGISCMDLTLSDDLPSMTVSDPKTKVAGLLGFTQGGDVGLLLLNADRKLRAAMALRTGDDPLVYLLHPSGNPAATMGIGGGKGYFSTSDSDNNIAWQNP